MSDNPLGVPQGIYSVTEACKWLRISRQSLTQLLIDHPHYAKNGNRKLFSQAHILQLWEAMQQPKRPSPTVLDHTGIGWSEVPTAGDPYAALRRRRKANREGKKERR